MSYYDPLPDPPFFAPAESEAPIQPSTSAQSLSSNPPTSSLLRKCSVKNCGKELPEAHSGKMCDECRGRHRIYASTKRQKRKMEKMAVASTLQSGQGAVEGAVLVPHDPGHGRSVQPAHPPLPGPIASTSSSAVDGGESNQPDSVQTPAGWDAQIDPRLFQSSSGLAGATSLSSPNHVEDEETPDHDERVSLPPGGDAASSASLPTRYCSIKGCRQILPVDHSYKMCQSCRDRYREYGNVKREKWKKNKEAALASLEQARRAEEQRRKEAGLPSLGELPAHERKAWEENLMPRVPPPPPTGAALPPIRMCTVSHCHVILSGDYEYRRCEQHRVQNRHHSKLKRVRDKEEKGMLPSNDQASSSSPTANGGAHADAVSQSDVEYIEVAGREDHVCQIKGCYNFLDPRTPWLMCEVHRQIDQGARKRHTKQPAESSLPPSAHEPSGSSPAPVNADAAASGAIEVILAASSAMPPSSDEHVSPVVPHEGTHVSPNPMTSVASLSTAKTERIVPNPTLSTDDQANLHKDSSASTSQAQHTEATSDETSTDQGASKDVHLHPKLRVPYFFHPAYVSYPGHPPVLMSIPSPFAPPAPGGLPPNQFGPSQFVQASSPFVQGGPYAYPYMMPIPPPTQPSPFTNPSSAPSPFASAPYPMAPGWYGPQPPQSENQEEGPHSTAASMTAAKSVSATSRHPSPASRPETSFMSTMPPAPRPLTFKHAPGSSVFNTPPTPSALDTSSRPQPPASPTAPASPPLPPTPLSSPPFASSRPPEHQRQPEQSSSHHSSAPSPAPPSVPAFYNPGVATAALASAENTLASFRRGSDPVFAPTSSRPGVRRRSGPLVDKSGGLEIVMYDPALPNRKRKRLDDGDTSPETTPGPSTVTPGQSNATPALVNEVPNSSSASEPHGPSSSTHNPTVHQTRNAESAPTFSANEAMSASSKSITQSYTSPPPVPSIGVPVSVVDLVTSDTSHPGSGTSITQSQPSQVDPITIPHTAAATPAAIPTRVCAGTRCRRKVLRAGALCERCVGKTKHAKQVLRARYRLEPVKIQKKVSIRSHFGS